MNPFSSILMYISVWKSVYGILFRWKCIFFSLIIYFLCMVRFMEDIFLSDSDLLSKIFSIKLSELVSITIQTYSTNELMWKDDMKTLLSTNTNNETFNRPNLEDTYIIIVVLRTEKWKNEKGVFRIKSWEKINLPKIYINMKWFLNFFTSFFVD